MKQIRSILLYLFFLIFLAYTSCKTDSTGGVNLDDFIKTGTAVQVASSTISTAGGDLTVSKPGTPVDGLQISVSPDSYSTNQTFTVSYADIKSHNFGENFHPITPLINIKCDGGYSAEIMTLTVPVTVPAGSIPIGFYLDAFTGKLEGIPVLSATSTTITFMTRHFLSGNLLHTSSTSGAQKVKALEPNKGANIIVCSISESLLNAQPIISSGFKPGTDDWEFVNYGSYLAVGGHCAGQNMAAMWYYFEKKSTEGKLFNKFNDTPNLWQSNAIGYRFCSVIHSDLGEGLITNLFDKYIDRNQDFDKLKLLTIAGTMFITGEPQGIGIYRLKGTRTNGTPIYGGHDLICYQVSVSSGKLYISDPNTPNTPQYIEFSNNKFKPYNAKTNGHSSSNSYPYITYYAKTAWIDWALVGKRYTQLMDSTIGNVAPNTFPSYSIQVLNGASNVPLTNGFGSSSDTLRTYVELPTATIFYINSLNRKPTRWYAYNSSGVSIARKENIGVGYVLLKPGLNKIGYYIVGFTEGDTISKGVYDDEFIDFKWYKIYRYVVKVSTNPIVGNATTALTIKASHFKSAPANSKFVWDFGDGSGPVTQINDSTVSHTFASGGTYNVKVEMWNNATNTKLAEAKATAQIGNGPSSSQSFNYSWVRQAGVHDITRWPRYNVNYSMGGTVEASNGNTVVSVTKDSWDGVVYAKFSKLGSCKLTFNGAFSITPVKMDTTYSDGSSDVFSFTDGSGMSWYTQTFSPYQFSNSSSGVYETTSSGGSIYMQGFINSKLERYDKSKKLYDTVTGQTLLFSINLYCSF